jgi:hypothetical protein
MNDDSLCKNCKHPFSSHDRKLREASTVEVDPALLGTKSGYDINSDRAPRESGCRECSCIAFRG